MGLQGCAGLYRALLGCSVGLANSLWCSELSSLEFEAI